MKKSTVGICALLLVRLFGGTSAADGSADLGSSASSTAPGWAQTLHVAVRDGSGDPVHFSVAFLWDNGGRYGGTHNACSDRPLHVRVPHPGARVNVHIHAAIEPCFGVPSQGSITLTYGGRGRTYSESAHYSGPSGVFIP